MLKLAPSILAADFSRLGDMLKQAEDGGAHYAHIDVMDGCFVPNISVGPAVVESLRTASKLVFDVHLMIVNPECYVKNFAEAGADIICFHLEAAEDPISVIDLIKEQGVKAAIAIKPGTPAESLFPYLDKIHMALIMSVEPGYGGQKLMRDTLGKARRIRDFITSNNLNCDIEMDGGIRLSNANEVISSGVNVLVSGTDVFAAPDIKTRIKEYLNLFNAIN